MPLKTNNFYDFEDFRLDLAEKVLLRDGKPVSLTPKVYETLKVLVENHGRLLEKNELMKLLWHDHFVEESNLTFNIKMLRKALGDKTSNPKFIETVPRRGYRFIAEVRKKEDEIITAQTDVQNSKAKSPAYGNFLIPAFACLLILFFSGFWYVRSKNLNTDAPILSAPFEIETLTTNGKTLHAIISPDGKNVIYTQGLGNEKQSVWLRQLDSGNNIEIIPPTDDFYYGLALSPDGNTLYFVRYPRLTEGRFDIFRVSIFGGIPQKILSQAEGWISISNDGKLISFVRCSWRDDEFCSLFVADALDGGNERKIVSRPRPFRIGGNRFSPDGNYIAFAVGQSETAAQEFSLMEVEVESGVERALTSETFFNIPQLAWLPDGNGLLFTASRLSTKNFRLWQVSRFSGEISQVSKDSGIYSSLSLNKDATLLVSTQFIEDFQIRLFQTENPSEIQTLAKASSVSFASNGKIIFSSMTSGNDEIWSVNPDGSGRRQLTNNSADDVWALPAPDGNSIFFTSNRTSKFQIWKMSSDGTNQTQITRREAGLPLIVTNDGHWLYFQHSLHKSLWRVPTEGGEEQLILDKKHHQIAVSPDGMRAAFPEKIGAENVIIIISLADGKTLNTFKLTAPQNKLFGIKWSTDGENLTYISAPGEYENKTMWRQPLNGNSPQKIADLGSERMIESCFSFAPDGKTFTVVQGGWRHDAVLLKGLK